MHAYCLAFCLVSCACIAKGEPTRVRKVPTYMYCDIQRDTNDENLRSRKLPENLFEMVDSVHHVNLYADSEINIYIIFKKREGGGEILQVGSSYSA